MKDIMMTRSQFVGTLRARRGHCTESFPNILLTPGASCTEMHVSTASLSSPFMSLLTASFLSPSLLGAGAVFQELLSALTPLTEEEGIQFHFLRCMKEKNFRFLSIKGKKKKISGTSTLCVQKRKKIINNHGNVLFVVPCMLQVALCASRSSAEMITTPVVDQH